MIVAAAVAWLGACSVDPCDPGQTTFYGYCVGAPDAGHGGDAGSTGGAAGVDGGADGGDCSPANFNVTCTDTAQCGCPTDLCAILPGAASGYCSRKDCLQDPSICPAGWTCVDLSIYKPGLSVCAHPT
jgi:hypothetical protein